MKIKNSYSASDALKPFFMIKFAVDMSESLSSTVRTESIEYTSAAIWLSLLHCGRSDSKSSLLLLETFTSFSSTLIPETNKESKALWLVSNSPLMYECHGFCSSNYRRDSDKEVKSIFPKFKQNVCHRSIF